MLYWIQKGAFGKGNSSIKEILPVEAKHPLKSFYLTGGSTQLVNERKDDAQAKSTYSRVLSPGRLVGLISTITYINGNQ